ncbi:Bug family tripartite tricarboxylate transporter substrate binding protein [Pigmentiphaga litoralis]|uniref:Tripartite-type tricarboxylate transporter receptor subunit TctC n=1 Tax=Pigmentiphaga litoralis TaxID=516702 RepID=A0A7Y9IRX5_9BURK|nr:tripartite tricarboxylate transporter substrate binding protein [Pigmentiphaga litoralis]NYE24489.1 tripartite-type tricarboxylate transporter receptor subunit TctC [Pigmentiphaga litoralis]NYE81897.1 tripartite-type tricarboxylate transporter receptor subunit TctC [Pigmentiphaga litoralis]
MRHPSRLSGGLRATRFYAARVGASQLSASRLGAALVGAACLIVSTLVSAQSGAASNAQSYPNRPIRLLLGFAPGGGSDIVARLVARPLGERLGQNVIVENKPGAGGNIAADQAAKATPDGYTLVLLPSGHASNAAMKKSLPFKPVDDYAWISTVTTYPLALVVAPDSPIQSFGDFITKARAAPNTLTYSSVGVGTAMHLVGEWILSEANITAVHVPFKGGTAPLGELLAGRVNVMIDTMTSTATLLKEQRVRALAVTAPKGGSPIAGVPTVADTLPNVVFESWLGIAAPAGTPPEIVAKLNDALRAVLAQPDIRQRLTDWGGSPQASTPAEFRGRVERDIASLQGVMRERKIEQE